MTRVDRTSLSPPWGTHTLPADEDLQLSVGPLGMRIRLSSGEIWLAHASGDWARPEGHDAAKEPDWIRWPVPGGEDRVSLVPTYPDRPLVVVPETSFRLLPEASARIYVRVPLWVAVELADGKGPRLTELPTVVLSDTWWGSFAEGHLCYWLPTSARREVPADVFSLYQAVCPLALVNRADEELAVEKIAVRVEHLSVFARDGQLWSNETRVKYRGEERGSEIEVGSGPPEEVPDAERVSGPRTRPPSRAIHARTFARLRVLSGMGGE